MEEQKTAQIQETKEDDKPGEERIEILEDTGTNKNKTN